MDPIKNEKNKLTEFVEKQLIEFNKFIIRDDYLTDIKNRLLRIFSFLINNRSCYISIISIIIFLIFFLLNNLYYSSGLEWKNVGKIKPGQIENNAEKEDLYYKNYERTELKNKKLSLALSSNKTYGEITKIPKDQIAEFEIKGSLYNKYIQSDNIISDGINDGDYFVPVEGSSRVNLGFSVLFFSMLFFLIYFFAYRKNEHINKDSIKYTRNFHTEKSQTDDNNLYDAKFGKDFFIPLKQVYISIFKILIGSIIPILIITLILYSYNNFYYTHGIIIFILSFIFVIIFLAIIFTLFKSYIVDLCKVNSYNENDETQNKESSKILDFLKNLLCIIINLVFALPCILLILLEKFKQELKITKPVIFLLLILEIIIILLIYLIPQIYKKIATSYNKELLDNKPVKLNTITTLSYLNILQKNGINKDNPINLIKLGDISIDLNKFGYGELSSLDNSHEYSINFNLYIKPTEDNFNDKEVNIIDFCKQPQITYNSKTHEIIFKTLKVLPNDIKNETMIEIYRTNYFKLQRFNNITINYYDNNIDIFINGYLRHSSNKIDFNNLGKRNDIVIGDKLEIRGTLKDLYYYNKKQSSNTVNFLSKLIDNNDNIFEDKIAKLNTYFTKYDIK
jgi:hypothetical protein